MEEKAQRTKEYLSTQGFDIPDLYSLYQTAGSKFVVDYHKSFGKDSMKYQLSFSWDHQFDNYRWDGYKAIYTDRNGQEKSDRFSTSSAGIAHANLAYNILSGKLQDIREKLWAAEIEEFTSDDVNAFLENVLCQTPDSFNFYSFKNGKEGLIEFEVKIDLRDSFYEPSDILATFIKYPDISHGIINGVDTAELQFKMAAIDWNRDGLYVMDENGLIQTSSEVEKIFDDLSLLLRDENGKEIALNLQFRHWHEVPFFEAHVHADAWKLYESLPSLKYNFPLETGAFKIYNLMCGRAVISQTLTRVEQNSNVWHLLTGSDGKPTLKEVEGPSRQEIETFLTMLPFDDMDKERMLTRLLRGDICSTTLYGLEPIEANIFLDLPAKTLKITSLSGETIPYNFRLEPTKQQSPQAANLAGKWERRQRKKSKNRKGRGL